MLPTLCIYIYLTYIVTFLSRITPVFATKISATTPVNPVQQSGILSLHCQVWNLEEGQDVIILRTLHSGTTQKLSLKDTIINKEDERTFLAVRQGEDGSVIYFLSMIDIIIDDSGIYSCRVLSENLDVVDSDSVTVNVLHFPEEIYPICSPSESYVVHSGSEVTLTCSSAIANPPVQVSWSRTGDGHMPDTTELINDGIMSSTVTLQITHLDNNALFLCEISSSAFPGQTRTCHIGPLVVLKTEEDNQDLSQDSPQGETPGRDTTSTQPNNVVKAPVTIDTPKHCRQACATLNSPDELFWIVVTVITSAVAFTFIIIVVVLALKFWCLKSQSTLEINPQQERSVDCNYAELEGGKDDRNDNSLYMALNKADGRRFRPDNSHGFPSNPFECQYVLTSSQKP